MNDSAKVADKVTKGPDSYYEALVLGDDIILMPDTVPTGKDDIMLSSGTEITILEQDSTRLILGDSNASSCSSYGYYRYRVKTAKGDHGWVYGGNVYLKSTHSAAPYPNESNKSFTQSGTSVVLGKETYYLYMACDVGIGPSNEEGLTGCDKIFYPFFVDHQGQIYFIKGELVKDPGAAMMGINSDLNNLLFYIFSSEGGSCTLDYIEARGSQILIRNTVEYQDDGASSQMTIVKKGELFEITNFELNRKEENSY